VQKVITPKKKTVFKIDSGSTFGEIKSYAVKELKLDPKEQYTFIATQYGQDVIEFVHRHDDDKSTLRDFMTVFVLAPAHLKPVREVVKKEKKKSSSDDEPVGAEKYKGLSPQNAFTKLEMAKGKERTLILQYIDIFASEIFKTKPFTKLTADQVADLVKRDTLNIEEVEVFDAVMAWAKTKAVENKLEDKTTTYKELLKNILPHIRFPIMTTEQVAAKVSTIGILDSQTLLELFTYLARKGKDEDEKLEKIAESIPFSKKERSGRTLPSKTLNNTGFVNWAQNGFMFNINAKKKVIITGLSVTTRNAGTHPIQMWWRQGTCQGYGNTSSGWEQTQEMRNMSVIFQHQQPSKLPVELKIKLKAGESCGIYFHTTDSNQGGIVSSGSHSSNDIFAEAFADENITVTNGPSHTTQWSGEASYACTLIGSVHYQS